MQLLQKAQTEFIFSAIAETYSVLNCADFFLQPCFLDGLVVENQLNKDAVFRFMHAAVFLGMCKKNEDGTFQHVEEKQFDKGLSETLFNLISSGFLTITPVNLERLDENQKKLASMACGYGLLENYEGQISIPDDFVSYYDSNSSNYIGPMVKHYQKIMLPMYSCEGILLALKNGTSQWQHFFGQDIKNQFEAYGSEPELLEIFTLAIHKMNLIDNAELLKKIDLSSKSKVLDLGGGSGALAGCIADVYNDSSIDIYELEAAIPMFRKIMASKNKTSIANYISGDFKKDVVSGELLNLDGERYDAIFLSWILHDWDDETCINILKKVKHHLKDTGCIYVLEGILPNSRVGKEVLIDIAMLLQTEGRERTFDEYKSILFAAGFDNVSMTKTAGKRDIIMAEISEI
jgi:SAM-dependent methyltransferase